MGLPARRGRSTCVDLRWVVGGYGCSRLPDGRLRGLWDARRTRHGQLITEIQKQWTEPDILEAIRLQRIYKADRIAQLVDAMFGPETEQASEDEETAWATLAPWPNLIESVGVLCEVKAITPKVVYKMWGVRSWKRGETGKQRWSGFGSTTTRPAPFCTSASSRTT